MNTRIARRTMSAFGLSFLASIAGAEVRYRVLDTAQLPRPMQIGIGGVGSASEWSLGVERSFRLSFDTAK